MVYDGSTLTIGRVHLRVEEDLRIAARLGRGPAAGGGGPGGSGAGSGGGGAFCGTVTAMRTLEAVAAAVQQAEPVLLVGETGTGKTSAVQFLADRLGARLTVVNLNQQTDASDLLGGFKPVDPRALAQPILERLMALLPKVTSEARNASFLQVRAFCFQYICIYIYKSVSNDIPIKQSTKDNF